MIFNYTTVFTVSILILVMMITIISLKNLNKSLTRTRYLHSIYTNYIVNYPKTSQCCPESNREYSLSSSSCNRRASDKVMSLHGNTDTIWQSPTSTGSSYDTLDTIYALSSGPIVKCGVSVIRISGPKASYLVDRLTTRPINSDGSIRTQRPLEARKALLRKLYCPKTYEILDEALILWFPRPHSFTGEDVVELHLHGSRAVILGVFAAFEYIDNEISNTNRYQAIRPAERGEFTRRAFDNGKMDLTAVEGLADLLEAETSEQRKQALKQMDGYMMKVYDNWRTELISCLAHTEAVIDFGDDDRENDIDDSTMWALIPRIQTLKDELQSQLSDGRRGEIVREGIKVALVGPPNAGKSSLINSLAKRPLAIVSPIAGTTRHLVIFQIFTAQCYDRDIVEVRMDLNGISCIICDTAGLREHSDDPIEQEGMRRAREAYQNAQIKVFVCDMSLLLEGWRPTSLLDDLTVTDSDVNGDNRLTQDAGDEDDDFSISSQSVASKTILVLNKVDLVDDDKVQQLQDILGNEYQDIKDRYWMSCSSGKGLQDFEIGLSKLVKGVISSDDTSEGVIITRERHRRHVKQCVYHLNNFLQQSLSMDLAAEELRLATQELGKITGRVDVEEILDVLFRDFCIGK